MIKIMIKAGEYTLRELRSILSKEFKNREDLEKFITAMEKTNQLSRRGNKFVTEKLQEIVRTIYPEFTTYVYGGSSKAKQPRCGIRAGKEWQDKYGFPEELHITSIRQRDGKWIPITKEDRVTISAIKGRTPEGKEAWRAHLPRDLNRKYNIKCPTGVESDRNTKIRVAVTTRAKGYFVTLILWGYSIHVEQTFNYNRTSQGKRNIELRAEDFAYSTGRNITELQENYCEKVKRIKDKWCKKFDPEYHYLFNTAYAEESGRGVTQYKEEPTLTSKVILYDVGKRRTLGRAEAVMPRWYFQDENEIINRLITIADGVAHGIKSRLVQRNLPGSEGF